MIGLLFGWTGLSGLLLRGLAVGTGSGIIGGHHLEDAGASSTSISGRVWVE